ncbi:MAG: F0F1 ATP synthase subunit gamma [Alphaproteobacteria bacterium]|nr:F0F1 ATP synthase subunit gamma [Alphaproteobacteria bacterium]
MSEVARIRRRLVSLRTLSEAVTAMSSLSAHHLRQARDAMPSAAAYEADLGQALARAAVRFPAEAPEGETLLLVVGSHLGLCGGYNGRVAEVATGRRAALGPGRTVGVGRRLVGALGRRKLVVDEAIAGVTSLAGVPALALALAERALVAQRREGVRAVEIVSARFHGIGSDRAEARRVLPLALPAAEGPAWTVRYTTPARLAEESARELLYVGLVASITEAMVCEHAARLLATRSAGDWLEDRVEKLRRKEASARQEQSTQETLEVVSAARALPELFR